MIEKEETKTVQPGKADTSGNGGEPVVSPADAFEEPAEPIVVYRRAEPTETNATAPAPVSVASSVRAGQLSPAIVPLIVGFLLLLVLIAVLGLLSVNRMDEVGHGVLNLEQEHAAKLSLLLKLRLAVTKLDNEARIRAEADARRELKPPFDL